MSRASPAPERRRSVRPGMRRAFAFSLAGHLCVAVVLVQLDVRPRTSVAADTVPLAIRVLGDEPRPGKVQSLVEAPLARSARRRAPPPTVHPADQIAPPAARLAPSPSEASAEEREPRSVSTAAVGGPEGGAVPDGIAIHHGGQSSALTGPTTVAGAGKANSAASAQPSGWNPGGPQWQSLRESIQRHVVYPEVARRMGWQGKVVVTFILRKDGQIGDSRILASSGYPSLDSSALQAVERAAPVPRAFEATRIVMPIVFALR